MNYLLDTNVIIRYLNSNAHTLHLLDTLATRATAPFAVSTVTQAEVWEGVYRATDPEAVEREYEAFFVNLTVLPFASAVAKRCAKLRHDLRQRSIRTRERGLDLQIAATALYHGLELVTYNPKDYDDTGAVLYRM